MNRFNAILVLLFVLCGPACTEQDEWPGTDANPKLFIEGYVDPALGARVYVMRTVPLDTQRLYPGEPLWVRDAELVLLNVEDRSERRLDRDSLGVYSLPSEALFAGKTYRLIVMATGLPSVEIDLARMPPAPSVEAAPTQLIEQRVGPCSVCPPRYVKELRIPASAEYGIYFGNQEKVGFENFAFGGDNGDGFVSLGTESVCRVSYSGSATGSGCDQAISMISGNLAWLSTTALDTLIGHVAYVDPRYINYIDALAINASDFELRGQFLYNIQSEIPSNVTGGYGFVRAQHTTKVPVERP